MSKKISYLLKEYFEPEKRRDQSLAHFGKETFPIKANQCEWEIFESPERFSKSYKFSNRKRLLDFVSEVLVFEDEISHHGEIVIKFDEVTISVYTHTVNRITEIDQEYTRHIDNIHKDVLDFAY